MGRVIASCQTQNSRVRIGSPSNEHKDKTTNTDCYRVEECLLHDYRVFPGGGTIIPMPFRARLK